MNRTGQWFRSEAKRRWGKEAAWITGRGRFALLAHCGVLTITLWDDLKSAQAKKKFIDEFRCGHACSRRHEIIDLAKSGPNAVFAQKATNML